ncbi:MAG TPA: TonB-dependent receptor [Pyrinomonadaceae bacterium]|nr:TonB-dependent receptor [Pyrinomonadaceae bacterium]
MRKVLMFVFAMCLSLFAVGAMAQTQTTGSIEGTVTDPQGNAVPGVTVNVTSPNLINAQSAVSDDNGSFRVLNLPPGKYEVKVDANAAGKGFAEFSKGDVEVNLGRTATADVQLQLAGVSGTVTVTDTSGAAVDTSNNTTGTNVSSDQFSNFPTQRTVQSLYTIAPSVSRSGLRDASGRDRDPSVAGSSGPENNYILDGVTTTDPAFGGSGANLPFEFVQEVEIKTGAYGAEYGHSTGGIFNVITKSGGNRFTGDAFAYFTTKGLVRETANFPFTGAAPNGFSEIDAGFDIGGPIIKDKLWFFGAFNPQQRKNFFLGQTLFVEDSNKITTPFYSGKLTWAINQSNVFTFSTFADHTKAEGFVFGLSGFGANPQSFRGTVETGGSNYAFRLNSNITPTWIGEFSFGLHLQRANTLPEFDETATTDRFSVLRNGAVLPVTETTVVTAGGLRQAYVEGSGGTVQRNFVRTGFGTGGLESQQDRNRWEAAARFTNIYGRHTIKYGFEYTRNQYGIHTNQTGADRLFTGANAAGIPALPYRVENRFAICARTSTTTITCPSQSRVDNFNQIIAAGQGPAGVTSAVLGAVSATPVNPVLLLDVVRARSFGLNTLGEKIKTDTQGFYIQDDFKISPNVQFNFGLRWDMQQAYSIGDADYIKLNNFKDTLQPRVGLIWDFTGKGKGKLFINYARFVESPIPLDINVRASGGDIQSDYNLNASRLNAPAGSTVLAFLGNLGNHPTPADFDLKPQSVHEVAGGIEFEVARDFAIGARGIYRAQGSVIEDGSFDDGTNYFIFNPGESLTDRLAVDLGFGSFGRARRYYRALEFSANKRFSNNYQFIASYTYSSLIGNYEGLFRNDNGQADPNITSLFDLVSLLNGLYGRLPNDRPHQFKLDGSWRAPFKTMFSASFRAQSGIPFNALVPHPLYGDNEGFCIPGLSCVPRGTAIVPDNSALPAGNAGKDSAIGSNRTPFTTNLDIGVYHPIQFGENRQLRLQLDWFNVFNTQKAIRLDETFLINSGAPGIAPVPNPFFGTGTIFQFPSNLRLGVKFSF